jgi:hypothetical protein
MHSYIARIEARVQSEIRESANSLQIRSGGAKNTSADR